MGIYTGSDLDDVPNQPGVYALISQNPRAHKKKDIVVYVGLSNGSGNNGLKTRLKQHLVEFTSTAGNEKWPINIDISQIDKVYYWLTSELEFGLAPSESARIFEEYVKIQMKPMYNDSKTGEIPAHLIARANSPTEEMIALFRNVRREIQLPSYSNLVNRIQILEDRVESLTQIIESIREGE
jgi:hypothetical protein